MHLKTMMLCLSTIFLCAYSQAHATEFDQYLQQQQLIDEKFKIKNLQGLNEILMIMSLEDSRTLPLQIDQNIVIEKLHLQADRTELEGQIITPDFQQFEQQFGQKEVQKILHNKLLNHCDIFFEHGYQRKNRYTVTVKLDSPSQSYLFTVPQRDCKIK